MQLQYKIIVIVKEWFQKTFAFFTKEDATSMYNVIKGKIPRGLNGGVRVILNNRENTIPYVDPETKKMVKTKQGDILVKILPTLPSRKKASQLHLKVTLRNNSWGGLQVMFQKQNLQEI